MVLVKREYFTKLLIYAIKQNNSQYFVESTFNQSDEIFTLGNNESNTSHFQLTSRQTMRSWNKERPVLGCSQMFDYATIYIFRSTISEWMKNENNESNFLCMKSPNNLVILGSKSTSSLIS